MAALGHRPRINDIGLRVFKKLIEMNWYE